MSALKYRFLVQGLGIEKLLIRLHAEGYTLHDVRRVDIRTVELCCNLSESKQITDLIVKRGFTVEELPPVGLTKTLHSLKSRQLLLAFFLCALLVFSFSLRFIWHIDISGAGIYAGEVRSYLKEADIAPGIYRDALDLSTLCDELTFRLPHVAWVRADVHGMTLRIEITQGVPAPAIETEGENGNIVAACAGIIDSMAVYAGTPAVSIGDTVQSGDILIYGHERSSNETLVSVRARGEIKARTWLSESASISAQSYQSQRTGNWKKRCVVSLMGYRFSFSPEPNYLISEYERERIPLVGAWLPVWLERETIYEAYLTETAPDKALLQAESGRLAMQKLLFSLDGKDEIIDKWLDYSMIEGGIIVATATAEVLTDIAVFAPQTPE